MGKILSTPKAFGDIADGEGKPKASEFLAASVSSAVSIS
jgi:hypothetical protein